MTVIQNPKPTLKPAFFPLTHPAPSQRKLPRLPFCLDSKNLGIRVFAFKCEPPQIQSPGLRWPPWLQAQEVSRQKASLSTCGIPLPEPAHQPKRSTEAGHAEASTSRGTCPPAQIPSPAGQGEEVEERNSLSRQIFQEFSIWSVPHSHVSCLLHVFLLVLGAPHQVHDRGPVLLSQQHLCSVKIS